MLLVARSDHSSLPPVDLHIVYVSKGTCEAELHRGQHKMTGNMTPTLCLV